MQNRVLSAITGFSVRVWERANSFVRRRPTAASGLLLALLVLFAVGWAKDAFAQAAPGSADVTLAWDPVTTVVDGGPLQDLTGYRVHYTDTDPVGADPATWQVIDVGAAATSATVTVPIPAVDGEITYYFSVSAVRATGAESALAPLLAYSFRITDEREPSFPTNLRVQAVQCLPPDGFDCVASEAGLQ